MDNQLPAALPLGLIGAHAGALLTRLLAIADDAVVVVDATQRIVLFNEGAEHIFGYRMAEVLGQPLDLLLPEGARPGHARHVQQFGQARLAARRMGERRDLHGRRADGSLFDAEASIAHVEVGGSTYFAAILRDVSEAREAGRRLAQSEARFRGLAEAAPVGIFQTDAGGDCLYVNERWSGIAGMTASEARGQGWLRAVHPADRPAVQVAWQQALAAQGSFAERFRFLRPDGAECWVICHAVAQAAPDIPNPADRAASPGLVAPGPAAAPPNRLSGYIGTVTDVTESHRQALALEQARQEAEAAVRAKSHFLANMSHELRTPLNAVIGMTTLLLDTPMSEDQRDFARTIRGSGESLLELINDILDFSKAEVGKLEIEARPFDLRRCLEDALDLVAPRALEKRLNLACLIEDGTPEALVGDVTRIRQIVVNLLSNAVKFTHRGEVLLLAEGRVLPPAAAGGPDEVATPRWQLRLAVKDTGIGIAADQLPRLFRSFSQVDASTTRQYGGTGLGLAISRRLAELMGGSLTVESRPGLGSVFTLSLALAAADEVQPADFLQRDVPALAGKRLLIVDDNLTNRRILTKLALLWGMLPATLPSALEALDRIRHGEVFDAAVLDVSMPEIDGITLAREIRRRRSEAELPILLLTSLGQRGEAPDEVSACLAKPIKAGELFTTLLRLLDGGQAGGLAVARPALAVVPLPARPVHPLKVLVAEDNPVNQRVALRLLERLGYAADLAGDGREAITAVQRQPYDVVLMDIQMPEMDGLEAARRLCARRDGAGHGSGSPLSRPRIIAMTANAMPGDREDYLAAGMDGYVAKPIELQELALTLAQVGRRLMAGAPGDEAGSRPAAAAPARVDEPGLSDRALPGQPAASPADPGTGPIARSASAAFAPTTPAAPAAPVIDLGRLEHLREMQSGSLPSLVRELIDLYVAEAPGQTSAMQAALAQALAAGPAGAPPDTLMRLAHRHYSTTSNLGAWAAAELCREIEHLAREARLTEIPPRLDALHLATRSAVDALLALRMRY